VKRKKEKHFGIIGFGRANQHFHWSFILRLKYYKTKKKKKMRRSLAPSMLRNRQNHPEEIEKVEPVEPVPETIVQPNHVEKYPVIYCQDSNRKHKHFDDDGTLTVDRYNRKIILFDKKGEELCWDLLTSTMKFENEEELKCKQKLVQIVTETKNATEKTIATKRARNEFKAPTKINAGFAGLQSVPSTSKSKPQSPSMSFKNMPALQLLNKNRSNNQMQKTPKQKDKNNNNNNSVEISQTKQNDNYSENLQQFGPYDLILNASFDSNNQMQKVSEGNNNDNSEEIQTMEISQTNVQSKNGTDSSNQMKNETERNNMDNSEDDQQMEISQTSVQSQNNIDSNSQMKNITEPDPAPTTPVKPKMILPDPNLRHHLKFNPTNKPIQKVIVSEMFSDILQPDQREDIAFMYKNVMDFNTKLDQDDYFGCILSK
jgi:hypothetical protein